MGRRLSKKRSGRRGYALRGTEGVWNTRWWRGFYGSSGEEKAPIMALRRDIPKLEKSLHLRRNNLRGRGEGGREKRFNWLKKALWLGVEGGTSYFHLDISEKGTVGA